MRRKFKISFDAKASVGGIFNIGVEGTYIFHPIKYLNGLKKICKEHLETEIDSSWIYIYKNWYCVCIGIDNFKTFSEINTSFSNALIELSKFKS